MCVYLCENKHKKQNTMSSIRKTHRQIYISKEVSDRLKEYCQEEGFVMSAYTNKIIDKFLKDMGR